MGQIQRAAGDEPRRRGNVLRAVPQRAIQQAALVLLGETLGGGERKVPLPRALNRLAKARAERFDAVPNRGDVLAL
ncbi:hypothetical protein SDC9_187962 [bioreactor metagenome]|uniref:Uncharacterized protein n=1 Tax=bioreactor metagenome TaxID=1076179 RepID=A0A645HMZ8_9ZZZZ